ncbi:hypothetical protein QQF64_000281 [Cirrhinus molitorella]|uniref:HD domain-containing protein n=1 Tax=Cirrhinus molitorella TaxID=172907 RepID=A0ABR3NWQ8_9TELE
MSQSKQTIKTLSDHRKSLQDLKKSYEESKEPEKQQIWEIITDELHDILKKYSLDFSKEQMKIFNDPIHGHMELHPLLVKIIDTPQFQRLRHIKQLGGTYLVYPGASHNRFEHSIGVAYLAGHLVKSLHDNQSELKITKQDFLCVQIAGLCHDLGHGPASHAFDNLFIPEAKKMKKSKGLPDDIPENCKHEQMSVKMFEDIVKSLKAENKDVLNEHGLDDKDVTFIKELIEGEKTSESDQWTFKGRDEDKSYLYEIVANKHNGIDVDKWDYFARDCHHLGIRNSFDHLRLLKFARVCKVNERNHICFRDKEADNVYDMFRTRYTLHRQAYQHKIANIIEDMLAEALLLADRDLHEGKPKDMLKISEAINTAEDYSKLTDDIFEQILSSTSDNLKKSRNILDKIVRRKLPKFVGEARLTKKNTSKELTETWKTAIKKYNSTGPTVSLNAEDFPVYVVDLDHGMKDKNPIEYVYFYSKRKPNEASAIESYQLSSFLPDKFNEELVRVYYKRSDDQAAEDKQEEKKKVEEAEECFQICVAYLAGHLVKSLHDNQSELKITKQDLLCVQIAGLCHDLGLPDDFPKNCKHEQMSVQMFEDIVKSLKAENKDVLNEHGLDDKDVTFIKELVTL